mmetsp:Transcript_51652/g.55873  ORF Transcript_51652/g.55873 Transcript_51652/m.55873 type:complete len:97 (-) Transcript_51652:687-977(-)
MSQRLLVYKKEHHAFTQVPTNFGWPIKEYKNNNHTLVQDCSSLFESMDFDGGKRNQAQKSTTWRKTYPRLVAYQTQHTTIHVPVKYQEDPRLGTSG